MGGNSFATHFLLVGSPQEIIVDPQLRMDGSNASDWRDARGRYGFNRRLVLSRVVMNGDGEVWSSIRNCDRIGPTQEIGETREEDMVSVAGWFSLAYFLSLAL